MKVREIDLSTARLPVLFGIAALLVLSGCQQKDVELRRPNFLILMSDNHSWDHLGCYGDPVLETPTIDRIAEEGIRFANAFCPAPSCTPARASMLTGQEIWRLEEGANLWGTLPAKFTVYTDLLEEAGYLVGYEAKGWGPGNYEAGGWNRNPAGVDFNSFEEFYNERERGQPFLYWFSSRDPHRPFRKDGGEKAGIDPDDVVVPPYLPDHPDVRRDITDYYAEIQGFDDDVAAFLQLLNEMGEVDDTILIICSDNGWQMPRGLANLYDFGTRIPLIISMPERFPGGRVVEDFVSLSDFAPTILELAGLPIPADMTARSLVQILNSGESGMVDPERDWIVTARERHAFVRQGGLGYPSRAFRTEEFLYIRNYAPERWPAGDPPLYGDVDAHMLQYPCPTKMYMLTHRHDESVEPLFELAFSKRPREELYDLARDPYQMNNVADDPGYQETKTSLAERLDAYLSKTGDPREVGGEMKWVGAEYFATKDKTPEPSAEAIEQLGLEEEYTYIE